ncbi:MAG TPA: hypothetical protein VLS88_14090, partial [Polyangiales bacterium]|nr:hypothetical protein [Polyangiales bacterium]
MPSPSPFCDGGEVQFSSYVKGGAPQSLRTTVADVSERILREAFNEYFGVGPARYLQLRNLHRIYRTLRASEPD